MTATFDFDQLLVSVLETSGPQDLPSAVVLDALAETRQMDQRRPLVPAFDRGAWPARRFSPADPAMARYATVGLATLLALGIVAAAILVGSRILDRAPTLPGVWISTGPMLVDYQGRSSAELQDGRVLFVGGTSIDPSSMGIVSDRGQLFDPRTGAFTPTVGSLSEPRLAPSVTTLGSGLVLIAGGSLTNPDGSSASVATVDLFDPETGAFRPTRRMNVARASHTATLLADGRVLVAGGAGASPGDGSDLASAEIFDPQTESWTPAGDMPIPGSQYVATLLADGRVLFTGGGATAELFQPSTGTFTMAAPPSTPSSMIVGRSYHTATLLADGRVLIVGGSSYEQGTVLAGAELYDPVTGQFSATGSLATERQNHSATLLGDGRVLVAGGSNAFGDPLSAELYDPASGTFSTAASAWSALGGPAVRLADGRVFVAGTIPEIFDPKGATPVARAATRSDRTFVAAAEPVQHRSGHSATRLRDGRVLVAGGFDPEDGVLASAEIFDPKTGTFAATGSMSVRRSGHTAILLDDGRVLIAGGARHTRTIEIYDPATGQFSGAGSLSDGQGIAAATITAVQQPDHRIVLFGPPDLSGTDPTGPGVVAFVLDLGRAVVTGLPTQPRCSPVVQAIALADGRIAIVCTDADGDESAHVFDPASGQTVDLAVQPGAGPMSMVQLADGRILFASGVDPTTSSLYDPKTGQLTEGGTVPSASGDPSAGSSTGVRQTLLADGRVLIVSGVASVLWDPATGTSRVLPTTIAPLDGESATLLADGRVLIVGGTKLPPDRTVPRPPGAELFDPAAAP